MSSNGGLQSDLDSNAVSSVKSIDPELRGCILRWNRFANVDKHENQNRNMRGRGHLALMSMKRVINALG